jgi:hypothetical protein
MSMIFILIQTKFGIDINNDELLKIVWKPKEKKVWLSWVMCNIVEHKYIIHAIHYQCRK